MSSSSNGERWLYVRTHFGRDRARGLANARNVNSAQYSEVRGGLDLAWLGRTDERLLRFSWYGGVDFVERKEGAANS